MLAVVIVLSPLELSLLLSLCLSLVITYHLYNLPYLSLVIIYALCRAPADQGAEQRGVGHRLGGVEDELRGDLYIHVCVYIYIYVEREMCMYIYIYREREKDI